MSQKEFIETGKSVELAIEAACEKLGVDRVDCQWEIIDLPKKGFLGLKNTPAKVRVWIEIPEEEKKAAPVPEPVVFKPEPVVEKRVAAALQSQPAPQKQQAAPEPKKREPVSAAPSQKPPKKRHSESVSFYSEEKVKLAEEYLTSILKELGLDAELAIKQEDGGVCINVEGRGLGAIIGRRGETLDAIQYLVSLVANRVDNNYMRITIDCGDYRLKRRETLEALARKLSAQVLKTNVSRTLEPMNPFERRIIHATVSEIEGVSSTSIGEEPNRRVVITSPTARQGRSGGGRSGGNNRDRYSGGSRGGQRGGPGRRDDRGPRNDRRDRRPDRASQPKPPVSNAPPKKTPESAVSTDKPLYTKIDLD